MTPKPPAPRRKAASPKRAAPPKRKKTVHVTLRVNGEDHEVAFAPHKTLLEVLREEMGLVGTKHGCELGECGACTVVMDGQAALSCLVLALECEGREITTVEGLAGPSGPHPLSKAFADLNAGQCGYCTPGMLCASKALLDDEPAPSRETIRERLSGNLCRCTGYLKIFEAVERAGKELRGEPLPPIEGHVEPAPHDPVREQAAAGEVWRAR